MVFYSTWDCEHALSIFEVSPRNVRLPDKLQLYKTQRRRKYRQKTHCSVPISWRSNAGLKPHHVIAPKPSTIAPCAEFPVSSKPYAAFLSLDWLEPNEWMQKYSNLTKLANFLICPPSWFDSNRHAQFNASHDLREIAFSKWRPNCWESCSSYQEIVSMLSR